MSTEKEFVRWLHRPENSLQQNFQFALNAWQSADFTLSSKYEIVIKWLSSEETAERLSVDAKSLFVQFAELLQLKGAPPGLIEEQTKRKFVETLLNLPHSHCLLKESKCSRSIAETFRLLTEFEVLQDLYRTDYELHSRVYAQLFEQYELYLERFYEAEKNSWQADHETRFFATIMNSLKESAKRAGDVQKFDFFYCKYTIVPLTQVILKLRTHNACFFEEFVGLERQVTEQYKEGGLVNRILQMPLHVRLLVLECALVNKRNVEQFLQHLLKRVFETFLTINEEGRKKKGATKTPAITLTVAAYTLEMLRKHDVSLNFQVSDSQTTLAFLGAQVVPCVEHCKDGYLREVLMLLCAVLRLNPLILEQDIFQVTTWVIMAPKSACGEERQLFEEYLGLLMDMFRRLSRAEKLVFNLLKALKEWLSKFEITATENETNVKRKSNEEHSSPVKKARRSDKGSTQKVTLDNSDSPILEYLKIILGTLRIVESRQNQKNVPAIGSFRKLNDYWPSSSVGVAFSKLITGLMSKPSLVIWKTLLHSLRELLETLQQQREQEQQEGEQLSANFLFLLDLHASLLCQYLVGSRLVEQSDKFSQDIAEQRKLTASVLDLFKQFLLSHEHNKRTMSAFLECCYHVANFDLMLSYYHPDGMEDALANTRRLHDFLPDEDWTLIQQRILNFGESTCKFLFHRLLQQRLQAKFLLSSTAPSHKLSLEKSLFWPDKSKTDDEQLELLLKAPNIKWIVKNLKGSDKILLIKKLYNHKPDYIGLLTDDLEAFELTTLEIYEQVCHKFASSCQDSLLAAQSANFKSVKFGDNETSAFEKGLPCMVNTINSHKMDYALHALPLKDAKATLEVLQKLPIGYVRRSCKYLVFALQLSFYSDLKAAGEAELARGAFDILTDLLHFGQHIHIFKHFTTEVMLNLLPVSTCWEFYEFLFATIKEEEKAAQHFLNSLTDILKKSPTDNQLPKDLLQLTLKAIETLAAISGPSAKRLRKYLDAILEIYAQHIHSHFSELNLDQSKSNLRKDKKFVEKTLAGFAPYANSVLKKSTTAESNETSLSAITIDENFRRICKIYIGHSMDYRNPHALRLMQVALNHRQQLHFEQDEIEFVLNHYWQQLIDDLDMEQPLDSNNTAETTMKIIIANKTNEDLLLTLQKIESKLDEQRNASSILKVLALLAKCPFSAVKGAIFNEKFKEITCKIMMCFAKGENQQFLNASRIRDLLTCQQAIVENKMVPISTDTLDSILSSLMEINIKKFCISDTNVQEFNTLHLAMAELCLAIIKQRHVLLMDRIPQFMHIFKDLLQSIVWYKSDRQKDTALAKDELENLAELAMKLVALMHIIASHGINVKRVAPFVLTFVINLMVTNKRPTTLYPQIKSHIESICYDLVGICDHRVGPFILRCSNEAARQVYELLVKDYKKYHKFKGKV